MPAFLEARLTGGAGNTDPDLSLGGVMSSTLVDLVTALNNLFDNVAPSEATAGDVEYRAIDIYNSGNAAAEGIAAYVSDTAGADSTIDLGLDSTTGAIGDEGTAPSGVTFAHYTTGSRLSIPNIAASGAQRLWVRWTIAAGAPNLANDTETINISYA